MRDLCARVSTWAPLAGWPLEVICCGCLETPFERPPFSTAEGFRRVFEVIQKSRAHKPTHSHFYINA